MLGIPLAEVSVRWQEIEGSKLSPLLDAIQMFRWGQTKVKIYGFYFKVLTLTCRILLISCHFQGHLPTVAEICHRCLETAREKGVRGLRREEEESGEEGGGESGEEGGGRRMGVF